MDTKDVFFIGIASVSIVIAIISVMASAWSYEKSSEHERRMTEIAGSMEQEVREMTAALRALSLDMRKMRGSERRAASASPASAQHAFSASGEPISDVAEEVAVRAEEQRTSAVKRVAEQARGLSTRAGATKEQAETLAQGLTVTVDETLSVVMAESERTRETVEERAVLETLYLSGGRRPMRIRDLADQIFKERRLDSVRTLQAVERLHQANLLICDHAEGDSILDVNRLVSITPNGILSVAA